MSEKRYSLVYYANKGGAFIKDNENGIEWYHDSRASLLEIVDKLNEFYNENKELKVTTGEMEDYLARMEEENKELKYHLNRTEKELKEYKEFMSLG